MGYGEEPYDRFYRNVRALDGTGRSTDVRRDSAMGVAAPRFLLGDAEGTVSTVEYDVDLAAMERKVLQASDTSIARPGFAGLLGYSIFGFLEGREDDPIDLQVTAPKSWPVFLTLAPGASQAGSGQATAENFYALADSQILAGPELRTQRIDSAAPLYVAAYAENAAKDDSRPRIADAAMRAVVDYFGQAPFATYTVVEWRLRPVSADHAYDVGMEHLGSMTAVESVSAAPWEDARRRLFYAHHMAHAWIPKRAYGEGYFPFQWEWAPLIDTIWFSEGFVQYAAIDALARQMDAKTGADYRNRTVEQRFRATLREAPAAIAALSLTDLSRIASSRYSADFRFGMNVFARGGLMASDMDALIREKTGGVKSLREGLRGVVAWSAREKRAFRVDELWPIFREATGVDVKPIYDRWRGPQPSNP